MSCSLKNPISTHIYKLALKFTFNLVECSILCSFEVLILIVVFFISMYACLCTCYGTIISIQKEQTLCAQKYIHKLLCERKQMKNKQSNGKVDKKVDKVKQTVHTFPRKR